MQEINYLDVIAPTTDRMSKGGVFLTVAGDVPNVMTIGWGAVGFYWRKPVFTVIVRPQRHTHALLERAGEFVVSVPVSDPMDDALKFAGTQSGAQVDKFNGHGMSAAPATRVSAPIIAECDLHFECAVRLTQAMTPEGMDAGVLQSAYPKRDMHTMFFGEILACYATRPLNF